MIDVTAVPQRLKDGVGKAKEKDVLDGVLPQVVINPVHLFFLERLQDLAVERFRRGQIPPKGLLDDDPNPALPHRDPVQTGYGQLMDNQRKEDRGSGKIENPIPPLILVLLQAGQLIPKTDVAGRIIEIAGLVVQDSAEGLPRTRRQRPRLRKMVERFPQGLSEAVIVQRVLSEPKEGATLWEESRLKQPEQGGEEFTFREISRSAEDYQGAGLGGAGGKGPLSGPSRHRGMAERVSEFRFHGPRTPFSASR